MNEKSAVVRMRTSVLACLTLHTTTRAAHRRESCTSTAKHVHPVTLSKFHSTAGDSLMLRVCLGKALPAILFRFSRRSAEGGFGFVLGFGLSAAPRLDARLVRERALSELTSSLSSRPFSMADLHTAGHHKRNKTAQYITILIVVAKTPFISSAASTSAITPAAATLQGAGGVLQVGKLALHFPLSHSRHPRKAVLVGE